MKRHLKSLRKILFSILILSIAGSSGLKPDAAADEPVLLKTPEYKLKKSIAPGTSQEKLKAVLKLPHFPTPAMTFKVPVQIKDLPAPWRNGELLVDCMVFFGVGNNTSYTTVGGSFGRGINSHVLSSGSYQGEVTVCATDTYGTITNIFEVVAVAAVRKGDDCYCLGGVIYVNINNNVSDSGSTSNVAGYVIPCLDNLFFNEYPNP